MGDSWQCKSFSRSTICVFLPIHCISIEFEHNMILSIGTIGCLRCRQSLADSYSSWECDHIWMLYRIDCTNTVWFLTSDSGKGNRYWERQEAEWLRSIKTHVLAVNSNDSIYINTFEQIARTRILLIFHIRNNADIICTFQSITKWRDQWDYSENYCTAAMTHCATWICQLDLVPSLRGTIPQLPPWEDC